MEYGPWASTASGLAVDYIAPSPLQIRVSDIAAGLSRLPRFNGQTRVDVWRWDVAQHSLLAEQLAETRGATLQQRLAVLFHDAHEAYTGDLTSPFKDAIRLVLRSEASRCGMAEVRDPIALIQGRLQQAIHVAIGLPVKLPRRTLDLIHDVDAEALAIEAGNLVVQCDRPWGKPLSTEKLPDWPCDEWASRVRFIDRYLELAQLIIFADGGAR